MLYRKKIKTTKIDNYISGWEALNVVDESGKSADWHPITFWYSSNDNEYIDLYTNEILGNAGIEYRFIKGHDKPVYIANFPRALADLVYYNYKNLQRLKYCISDFLTESESDEFYRYLIEINKVRDIDHFMKIVSPKKYYEWKKENKENK